MGRVHMGRPIRPADGLACPVGSVRRPGGSPVAMDGTPGTGAGKRRCGVTVTGHWRRIWHGQAALRVTKVQERL